MAGSSRAGRRRSEIALNANGALAERYLQVRRATEQRREPLSAEDCQVQSMDDASPVKWHLAHTSWFFETFVLERVAGYRPFHPEFRALFNSYYQTVGQQHPRPQRGLLSRPPLDEVLAYRAHVDAQMLALLQTPGDADSDIVELGLQHEQQHQELILTDVKHMLSCNPLHPTYRDCPQAPPTQAAPLHWQPFAEGIQWIGHDGHGFCFDNEQPRHRVFIEAFELASRPTRSSWRSSMTAVTSGRSSGCPTVGTRCKRAAGARRCTGSGVTVRGRR
jgi:ergothioneine biosynthesis protein EgtB